MVKKSTAVGIKVSSTSEVSVEYSDGSRLVVHPLWLRERCQDAESLDFLTGQRLSDPSDFDLNLTLASVLETSSGFLRIKFSDGHEASFSVGHLLAEASLEPGGNETPEPEVWTGSLRDLPRARWKSHVSAFEMAGWLEQFLRFGFIIFSGVPTESSSVLKVASVFGYTRETNFGASFEVRSMPNASDLAYTPVKLDPHTDNPYRAPVPGIQLLHCLANETTGGLSTLVDGYAVAEALRSRDPEAFKILSTTPIRFRYRDKSTELIASQTPIELDVLGQVKTIHFSPRLDFVPLLPMRELSDYYRARRIFDHLLRAEEFEIRFLLNAGDLVMFDNCRLLHGRTSFNPAEGLRHLQGCYIDIDGPRSLYRVLNRQIATPTEHVA